MPSSTNSVLTIKFVKCKILRHQKTLGIVGSEFVWLVFRNLLVVREIMCGKTINTPTHIEYCMLSEGSVQR